jgi:hypothetical protein
MIRERERTDIHAIVQYKQNYAYNSSRIESGANPSNVSASHGCSKFFEEEGIGKKKVKRNKEATKAIIHR